MDNAALPGYPGTRGLNFWEADAALRSVAEARLTPQGRARAAEFGAFVGGPFDALIDVAHKAENLPKLIDGAVRYCPEQISARQHLARAIYGTPLSLTERLTRTVLSNYCGEGGITCPLAMTEGLIGLLEKRGTQAQKRDLIPRLRSDDAEWALTGGQHVTERQGGSNVAANETTATPNADGTWSLTGIKWFCSNPGELWVASAKVPNTGIVALFLVRRKLPNGKLNGHRILRQKPIGGTRGKATVEFEYQGTRAEMIGKPREGLVLLVNEILSVSRLHVAAGALGFAGRAVLEARTFTQWRTAYGKPLTAIASVAARLASMETVQKGMLTAFYRGLDSLETGDADSEAIVPLLKTEISRRGTALVREAQLLIGGHGILDDFSPLNRLADDGLINEIWEGTHPVLAGHAAKSLRRPRVIARFLARVLKSADPKALARFSALLEESRGWSEDERSLRDEELTGQAYALLAAQL